TNGWTDTGTDVHPGELIQITAAPPSASAQNTSSNPASTCDPNGVSGASTSNLPAASAAPGALIGKLGDSVFDVGANKEITATQQGRLFLGVNSAGEPPCRG